MLKKVTLCLCTVGLLGGGLLRAEQAASPEERTTLSLANGKVAMEFAVADGTVTSIKNRSLDVDYTVGTPSACLFMLKYLDSKTKARKDLPPPPGSVTGHALTKEGGRQTLTLEYLVPWQPEGAVRVKCQASLDDDSNEVRWKISINNQAKGLEIVEVVFPILGGLRIGARSEDNFLTWPAWGAGHLIPNPQNGTTRRGTYCGGGATMAWVDLFRKQDAGAASNKEPACGLYFASHDKTLLMTGLRSEASADNASLTLQMSKYAHVRGGDRWTSADFVTQLHSGDWHAGADAYRAWFNSWSPPAQPPQWLKQCDGRLELTLPFKSRFATELVSRLDVAEKFGVNFVRIGGQMIASMIGKRRCNRFPFPDPLMGTEAEFAEAISAIRARGGHFAFYINGQAWDPRWPKAPSEYAGKIPPSLPIPDWEAGFKENALKHYSGTFYQQYKKATRHWPDPEIDGSTYPCLFYLMCSAAAGWQDHLHYWTVEKYAKQYGTDAMFLDQIGAGGAKYCFNPEHKHRHHGVWTQGYMAILKRIKEDARKVEPDFALEIEGYGDAYSAHVDSYFIAPSSLLYWADSYPELTRYTFPDHIFFDGYWSIHSESKPLRTAAEAMNEVFLIGNRFLVLDSPKVLTEHTARLLDLRRRIKHVLYPARFMDDLGLEVGNPKVRVKRFVLDEADRKVTLLTIYNQHGVKDARASVYVGDLGPVREAGVAVFGGAVTSISPETSGKRVSIRVPPEVLSAVLLVHRGTGVIDEARSAKQLAGRIQFEKQAPPEGGTSH